MRSPLRKKTRKSPSGRAEAAIPPPVVLSAERAAAHAAQRAARRGADRAARRAAHGLTRHGASRPVAPRSALLAGVLMLAVVVIAVAVTGIVAVGSMTIGRIPLASPLLVYPVSQMTIGQCLPGVQGVTGLVASRPVCYQVTQGIAIHRVSELHVQHGAAGYDISIKLLPADAKAFADLTHRTVGRNLAFVVRGRLVTAPRVDMPITKGRILVTGTPTRADAERTVSELRGS